MFRERGGVGLLGAVEFVADRQTRRRFDPAFKVDVHVARVAREKGPIARAMNASRVPGWCWFPTIVGCWRG